VVELVCDPSFRALSGRLKFTVRRHKFNKDSCSCVECCLKCVHSGKETELDFPVTSVALIMQEATAALIRNIGP